MKGIHHKVDSESIFQLYIISLPFYYFQLHLGVGTYQSREISQMIVNGNDLKLLMK